ncbi:hypothetical protein [Clostridium perfringens]
MENNYISSEEFKQLSLEEQINIINKGINKEGTLKKVCENIGINSKHWSEKFRNAGYVFSKADKGFHKNDNLESKETKKVIKSNPQESIIKQTQTNKIKKTDSLVGNTFTFYYKPTGNNKKMGASVDTEVYKEFEKLCNKFNYINVSGHVSNALALYIKTLENK